MNERKRRAAKPRSAARSAEAQEQRRALEASLAGAREELPEALEREESARRAAEAADQAVRALLTEHGGEGRLDERSRKRLEKLRARAEDAWARFEQASVACEALNAAIARMEQELLEVQGARCINDVLAYQEELQRAEDAVKRIQTLKAAQQGIIDEAEQAAAGLEELRRHHEEVLAAVASGEADEAAAREIEARIAAIEKHAQEAAEPASKAQATLNGLHRRYAEAEAKRQSVQARGREVIEDLLLAEAEAVGARYRRAAERTAAEYVRLLAINQMLADQGSKRAIIPPGTYSVLAMPCVNLKVFSGAGYRNDPALFFSMAKELYQPIIPRAVETEIERLKKAGVTLFG